MGEGLRQSPRRGPYKNRATERKSKKKKKGSRGRTNMASKERWTGETEPSKAARATEDWVVRVGK